EISKIFIQEDDVISEFDTKIRISECEFFPYDCVIDIHPISESLLSLASSNEDTTHEKIFPSQETFFKNSRRKRKPSPLGLKRNRKNLSTNKKIPQFWLDDEKFLSELSFFDKLSEIAWHPYKNGVTKHVKFII
uniref:Uncharacterized protein n=1 Tax=Acrobeloides nanus TaxID=290746 RepID=A0A914D5C7_9BILA